VTTVVVAPYRVAAMARAGGHFWVYAQYVDALRRLGCDVWWLEELPPPRPGSTDAGRAATLLTRLRPFGLADRVVLYRWEDDPGEPTYLVPDPVTARAVIKRADLLLNFHYAMPGALLDRFRRTALVDIDPGMLQLWWHHGHLRVQPHDVHFSIGEHLDGAVPGVDWVHCPPVVSLSRWPYRFDPASRAFTSVTSWSSRAYVTLADGSTMDANKRVSYLALADLAARVPQQLEVATVLGPGEEGDRAVMAGRGWVVRSAVEVAGTPERYRHYVQRSRGELGIAKPAYLLLGNAWLSDRTVCYLASGKPAVVQDTGPSSTLPVGEGLLRFSSADEAAAALAAVDAHYERHCRAARELAETYFSAADVVTRMLDRALAA
jgi:hypothetical protein